MKKIILLLLFFAISLFANIGKISAFSGDVKVDRNAKLLNATIGFILEQKDTVKTSDNAKAQIVFEDGTVISIGKNAVLNINEFINDTSNPKNSKVDVKFAEGTFKTITGGIGKVAPDRFKLQTKSASIGIRGTIIYGDQSMIACTQGEIEVEAGGIKQILPAGTMTKIQPDGTPTDPEPIEDEDLGGVADDVGDTGNGNDGTSPQGNTEGEMEIEPLPTEGEGQQPLSDSPNPTIDNTQNTNNISQSVNSDTTNDTFQNVVTNAGNNLTLPEPFSFNNGAGSFYFYDLVYGDGMMFQAFENAIVNFKPLSFDANGNIISILTSVNPTNNNYYLEEANVTLLNFNQNDELHWGYWETIIDGGVILDVPWIVGIQTPVNIIENAHFASTQLSFSGKVLGQVKNLQTGDFSYITQDSFNSFTANIDFGGGSTNLDGTIQFNDGFNNQWKGSLLGGTTNHDPYFSGVINNNSSSFDTLSGEFDGNLYGSDSIKAIGGTFSMNGEYINNSSFRATGVFKAGVVQ